MPADAYRAIDYSGEDTTFTYEPTGTRPMANEKPHGGFSAGDGASDYCTKAAANANSWQAQAQMLYANDDPKWKQAQGNADAIAGEANADKMYNCNITYAE